MKRIVRNRRLTPKEAAELPELIAAHHDRMAKRKPQKLVCSKCKGSVSMEISKAFSAVNSITVIKMAKSTGWRKINRKWFCGICTGLLQKRLKGKQPTHE